MRRFGLAIGITDFLGVGLNVFCLFLDTPLIIKALNIFAATFCLATGIVAIIIAIRED